MFNRTRFVVIFGVAMLSACDDDDPAVLDCDHKMYYGLDVEIRELDTGAAVFGPTLLARDGSPNLDSLLMSS